MCCLNRAWLWWDSVVSNSVFITVIVDCFIRGLGSMELQGQPQKQYLNKSVNTIHLLYVCPMIKVVWSVSSSNFFSFFSSFFQSTPHTAILINIRKRLLLSFCLTSALLVSKAGTAHTWILEPRSGREPSGGLMLYSSQYQPNWISGMSRLSNHGIVY